VTIAPVRIRDTPVAVYIDGDVDEYTSLLDPDGNPAISYRDPKFFTRFEKPITLNWIAVEPQS